MSISDPGITMFNEQPQFQETFSSTNSSPMPSREEALSKRGIGIKKTEIKPEVGIQL